MNQTATGEGQARSLVAQVGERRRFGRRHLSNPHLIKMVRDPGGLEQGDVVLEQNDAEPSGSLRFVIIAVLLFWSGVGVLVFR